MSIILLFLFLWLSFKITVWGLKLLVPVFIFLFVVGFFGCGLFDLLVHILLPVLVIRGIFGLLSPVKI